MTETPAVEHPQPAGQGPQPADKSAGPAPGEGFGLPVAIALIMGSIIGVGIFNLPTSLAVYGPTPDAELRLITCGGMFDPVLKSYLSNIVVYAVQTASNTR